MANEDVIVVGVDGSSGSKAALRWALDMASTTDREVLAVNAWHVPTFAASIYAPGVPVPWVALESEAQARLDETLAEVVGDDDIVVKSVAVQGPAAHTLIDESRGAAMLVVGSRGRGGFAGLVLGSVSQQVAGHAECPVVVLPTPHLEEHEDPT